MCATSNNNEVTRSVPTLSTPTSNNHSTIQNQNRNKHSHGGKRSFTPKQSGSAQRPNDQSRSAKRARWAKRSKPVAKPVVRTGPVFEYISACCSLPASKPRCGAKTPTKDPETGRMKDQTKGLGHFRCSGCRKVCKVTPQKAAPKGSIAISVPDAVFPGPLTTPVLKEGVNVEIQTNVG
jgi:hypothetical protein